MKRDTQLAFEDTTEGFEAGMQKCCIRFKGCECNQQPCTTNNETDCCCHCSNFKACMKRGGQCWRLRRTE